MGYRISVDTGGTFTDIVISTDDGATVIGKALTTPDRIYQGMGRAIEMAAAEMGLSAETILGEAELMIYGTTRAINAVVQGRTAKTAMLVTEGFPHTLLLREGGRPNAGVRQEFPKPYIPLSRTFEVPERINAEGEVVKSLDRDKVRQILAELRDLKYEAIAVTLLWSIANAAHELEIGRLIEEELPGIPYTLSHQLLPIPREYRRASAAAIDASLKPLMQEHLREMSQDLREAGFKGELMMSSSYGGCMDIEAIAKAPIHSLKSGPAMAPVAARSFAREENLGGDVIVCDTGGTTFDVGLVRDSEIVFTRDTWIGGQAIGHIIATPTVDIRSVGAGGGSIAWIDAGGLLRVGPHSAGSVPGPAAYGRGGTEATVTDAAVVLGYFNPERFLGGRMQLDATAAQQAIDRVALRLNMTREATAWAILKVADELMIKAIQEITVSQGISPRESALVAGGGAAGLNIVPIAQELGIKRVLLPKLAGALSASGMQFANIVAEESATHITTCANFDFAGVGRVLRLMSDKMDALSHGLTARGLPPPIITAIVEARYVGQVWQLTVPLDDRVLSGPADVERLVAAFHRTHKRIYAISDPKSDVECLNWRLRAEFPIGRTRIGRPSGAATASPSGETRLCFFGDTAQPTRIYRSDSLTAGDRVAGPAIIEEPTTTLVVYPNTAAEITASGNYLLHF